MELTVKQDATEATEVAQEQEKTFTQAELDAIVGDRLKRERAKYEGFDAYKAKAEKLDAIEEQSKTELEKATEKANALQAELDQLKRADEIRSVREKIAAETGVPASLLTAETEEDCTAQAQALMAWAKPSYPAVKDDGEVTGTSKRTTRQQFADWFGQISN